MAEYDRLNDLLSWIDDSSGDDREDLEWAVNEITSLRSKLDACRKVVQQIARSDYIDERWQDWRAGDGYISELMAILDTPKEPE